ncbi:MAG: SgcJ/EcaC family oxidoreductase [Planctomycetes bacterium]|nr:SgcJ/EcaC family oxidoreductase [Planctomycetota bacterium]MBI3844897.1 SgcJ/EcaC family oxidoreductase [Planctomycetota bacterium]
MIRHIARGLAVACALALASCVSTGGSEVDSIREVLGNVASADTSENLDGIVALYTPDAEWLPPNGPPVIGIGAIREKYRALFESSDLDVEVLAHEIRVAGDWAFCVGSTRVSTEPKKGGDPTRTEDKFVMILQRCPDGRWRVRYLMWSPLAE